MADDPSRASPLAPERIRLGEASRILGVDPDTLRRWADEGRVPAFTTPGGHRRFERRVLERLVAARRTGPAGGLAGLGDPARRLSAAYRRRYGALHGADAALQAQVPASERALFREHGRRLVDALVRHLDRSGPERGRAERDAIELAAEMGDRLARIGVSMEDAVSMFVDARRPFLAELSVVAGRRGVDAARVGQLYETSSRLLDRLLLSFVAAHASARDEDPRLGDAADAHDAGCACGDGTCSAGQAAGPALARSGAHGHADAGRGSDR